MFDLNGRQDMETLLDPSDGQDPATLQQKLEIVCRNPVIDSLMQSVSGLLAIMDEQRRFLTVNDCLLDYFGVATAEKILGLRPGEAMACVHAKDAPGGCGFGGYCSSCGANLAIEKSLTAGRPEERICAATVEKDGREQEICFLVRSTPVVFENRRFLLLFMRDITAEHNQAALERVFFHDVSNILTSLLGATENLDQDRDNRRLIEIIRRTGRRLKNEIEIQRSLSRTNASTYQVSMSQVGIEQIVREVEAVVSNHDAAAGKSLVLPETFSDRELTTDLSLLVRILLNMLTNAFEVTPPGGQVKLWVEPVEDSVSFMVWNEGEIPPEIRPRVFQRHFTTKGGRGRGLGTYAMKLFGENILHGKVDFTSSREGGTVFRFAISGVVGAG